MIQLGKKWIRLTLKIWFWYLIDVKDHFYFKSNFIHFIFILGEVFTLRNIHNDMKISELMGYAEFETGIPKHMQRIRYLDECTYCLKKLPGLWLLFR